MIKLRSLPLRGSLCVLASAFLLPALSLGQGVAPAVRIRARIDESQLTTLRGNTNPHANARNDQGKVADSLPMTDLILVLSRDPAQQAAFDAYVASQYDQNSPNYHQWLTPDQIGEQFGPSQTDIQTITNWLTGHGFTVSQVTRDRMSIRFDGTAGLTRDGSRRRQIAAQLLPQAVASHGSDSPTRHAIRQVGAASSGRRTQQCGRRVLPNCGRKLHAPPPYRSGRFPIRGAAIRRQRDRCYPLPR